ncbi:hypothetical protein R3P38DRAFT_2807245 [Favolaschia claudopus]|uniref:Uncharacterized protein n=1 Tax=Favolaschia claudopus TaxID=2862362 RepID=A0AAV9ZI45_9AGAR
MGRLTAAQRAQRDAARKNSPLCHSFQENSADSSQAQEPNAEQDTRKTRSTSTLSQLRAQVVELTSSLEVLQQELTRLNTVIADLEGSNRGQAVALTDLHRVNEALRSELSSAESTIDEYSSELDAVRIELETEHTSFQKSKKRIQRLVSDKKKIVTRKQSDETTAAATRSSLEVDIQSYLNTISQLTAANQRLQSSLLTLEQTTSTTMKRLRAERKAFKMQAERAQASLAGVRREFTAIATWDAKEGVIYSMQTRRLVLRLSGSGCPEHKVKDIILACAEVFGINVKNLTLSARTVGRIKKEGGYFSLIQIGHEIKMVYGPLGSARVHVRYHPNSNPASFSAMERYRRNGTEAFVTKYITTEDLLHVMREVRKEDANGENAAFRKAVVEELESKARVHREKVRVAAEKKQEREANLRATGVERDRTKIRSMTVPKLKAQYDVYKLIVKDEIILKTTLVSIPRRQDKLDVVLAALDRYEANMDTVLSSASGDAEMQVDSSVAAGGDVEMGDVEKDELSSEGEDEEFVFEMFSWQTEGIAAVDVALATV